MNRDADTSNEGHTSRAAETNPSKTWGSADEVSNRDRLEAGSARTKVLTSSEDMEDRGSLGACLDIDEVTALLRGTASTEDQDAAHEHMADCPACRAWVSALARTSWLGGDHRDVPDEAPVVGRYALLVELGRGAMGTVWAAHDAELDREVAVKVLDAGTDRVLDEARALAALSHPNVVEVLDVYSDGPSPAIAMELVEGPTLGEWLTLAPRSWQAVLAMFEQAGRGLAAAHRAGLVHRDFKPSNALVGRDGRVRVVDFGLATTESAAAAVRWGGTPGYMAPEQHRGEVATARSDQYAWCVALFEALYGHRPDSTDVRGGTTNTPPRRLRRCLERGLAEQPEARWPSMDTLLDAVHRRPTWRRWLVPGAAASLCVALWGLAPQTTEACNDELGLSLWLSSHAPSHHALRPHVQAWESTATDACALAERRPEAEHCLERQAARLHAAAALFVDADALAAVRVAERLPSAQTCLRPPPVLAADELELDHTIAVATVYADAGQHTDAMQTLEPIRDRALDASAVIRSRYAYAFASASWSAGEDATAWYVRAARDGASGGDRQVAAHAAIRLAGNTSPAVPTELKRARAWLARAEALVEANPSRDLDRRLLIARGNLASLAAEYDDALRSLGAAVTQARADAAPPAVLADTLESLASVQYDAGALDDAERNQTEALELFASAYGPEHPRTSLAQAELAAIWLAAGRIDDARRAYVESLEQLETSLGPDHIEVGAVATNLAMTHTRAGDPATAIRLLERVQTIEQHLPPGRATASTLHNLGNAYVLSDDLDAARGAFETGLEHIEGELGPAHPERAIFLSSLASVALDQGRHDDAIELATRSRALRAMSLGEDDARLAFEDLVIAGAAVERGRPALALDVARRGERLLGSHPIRPRWLAELHYFRAQALVDLGRRDEARAAASASATTFEGAGDAVLGAEIRDWAREL
jgi:tetratricopeptide (TPR) repeat protein/predicted Ser/Thr protein kinase